MFQRLLASEPHVVLCGLTTGAEPVLRAAIDVLGPVIDEGRATGELPAGVDRAVVAEWTARLALSLMATPSLTVDVDDPKALRRFVEQLFRLGVQRMRARVGRKVMENMTRPALAYHAEVRRSGKYWAVHVREIDRWTQARHLRELEVITEDLIELMTGAPAGTFTVDYDIELPETVRFTREVRPRVLDSSEAGAREVPMDREALLARTMVELADTLVDDFDVVDLLTLLTGRCVELLDVAAAGLMLVAPEGDLRVVASSSEEMRLVELFELQSMKALAPTAIAPANRP